MSKPLKILVIRFSSIGDIVLTTPIVRCLKEQINSEVDYLTKSAYVDVINDNPHIRNIYLIDNIDNSYKQILRSNKYDIVIDLQNNLRSYQIRYNLQAKTYVLRKQTFSRWILIYLGVNLHNNHIVDRYFNAIKSLGLNNDNKGIDFFIAKSCKLNLDIPKDYITWCISATHINKKLPARQIIEVISKLDIPVLLIGGDLENNEASFITENIKKDYVINLCGKTTVQQSAYLIRESNLLLTNDTGMMHIASAFKTPLITFWGCTKPSLGFYPYINHKNVINIISNKSKKPCSKHGRYCSFNKDICINQIQADNIYESIFELLK